LRCKGTKLCGNLYYFVGFSAKSGGNIDLFEVLCADFEEIRLMNVWPYTLPYQESTLFDVAIREKQLQMPLSVLSAKEK